MRSVFYPHLVNGPFGDPALYVRLAYRGEALLFDCGDLAPLSPREVLKITKVFVSHAHIDHLVGFDALLRLFLYRPQPLEIYGPPGLIDRIAGRLSGYTWNLTAGFPFVLTVREWGIETGRQTTFAAQQAFARREVAEWPCPSGLLVDTPWYRIRTVPLDHGDIPSLAYSLEEPLHIAVHRDALDRWGYRPGPWLTRFKDALRRNSAPETLISVSRQAGPELEIPLGDLAPRIAHTERGMKITYVTDAAPSPANSRAIVALAAESHLLAIEAAFAEVDRARARERHHLTATLAGTLARKAGAARLLTFHHSPRYHDQPDLLAAEAERAFQGESMSEAE